MRKIFRRVLIILPIIALTMIACDNTGRKSSDNNKELNNLKTTSNMSTETKTIHLT